MRAVMVMFDTLTRNFLPNYGNDWVQLPNFARLKDKCVTMNQFYAGSLPCMPARRELHTGKYNFMHRRWGPLESFDFSVFEKLQAEGIYSHLVTDHSHYFEDGGATYHNRYCSWEGFRGQEGDRWMPRLNAPENGNHHALNKSGISVTQHLANRQRQLCEEELSSVRTIQRGIDFIRENSGNDQWLLQIECFDPHEPFYVPEKYRELYQCGEAADRPYWPGYRAIDWRERGLAEDIEQMRREYAALVTMCDHHLGRILDVMDEQKMWEDTLLIVHTDHGFLLGEHNYLGKNISPMYEELVHLPCFIHLPGLDEPGKACEALAQTIDLPATLLDYFGITERLEMDGKSLLPVLREEVTGNHETILFGVNGGHANIYDGRYLYMRASADETNGPYANYTMVPTEMRGFYPKDGLLQIARSEGSRFTNRMPCMRIPLNNEYDSYRMGSFLYDMSVDPQQKHALVEPEAEAMMCDKLRAAMKRIEAPAEEFIRLGLNQDDREDVRLMQ